MQEFIIIHSNNRAHMSINAADVSMITRTSAGEFFDYNEEEMERQDVRSYDTLTVFHMQNGETRTITTECVIICR